MKQLKACFILIFLPTMLLSMQESDLNPFFINTGFLPGDVHRIIVSFGISDTSNEKDALVFANRFLSTRKDCYTSKTLADIYIDHIHKILTHLSPLEIAARIGTAGCLAWIQDRHALKPESIQNDFVSIIEKIQRNYDRNKPAHYTFCIRSIIKAGVPLPEYYDFKIPIGFIGTRNHDLMKILLEAGADPNARDHGRSILTQAVSHRNSEIVRLLIEKGAHINYIPIVRKPKQGEPISDRVNTHISLSYHTALSTAIKCTCDDIAFYLLEKGADPNIPSIPHEDTPLMLTNNKELVRRLLNHGANIKHVNLYGQTALDSARERARDKATSEEDKKKYKKIITILKQHKG